MTDEVVLKELMDKIMLCVMHDGFHRPIVKRGFDENGHIVFLGSIARREKGCLKCDEFYSIK